MIRSLYQFYRLSKPAFNKVSNAVLVNQPYIGANVCRGTGLTIVAAAFCKMSPSRKKKILPTNSEERMEEAYRLVKKKRLSVRKAAKKYKVPFQILRDRLSREKDLNSSNESHTLFTEVIEKGLVDHILHCASNGYPLSRKEIINVASETAVYFKKRPSNFCVTTKWCKNFLGRWPELREFKEQQLKAEKKSVTPLEKFNSLLCKLENIMVKLGLIDKPELIFMVTEVDFYTFSRKDFLVDQKSLEQNSKTADPEKTARILACGNAAGTALPPYFVFKGQRCKKDLFEDAISGVDGKASLDGCSNPHIYRHFLHHFISQIPANKNSPYKLLLHDQRFSHIPLPFITEATKRNIILFALPSYAWNFLQPLDECLRKPLKSSFIAECERYLIENPLQCIIRDQICGLVCKAYMKGFAPVKLKDSFTRMGIFPPGASDEIRIDDKIVRSETEIANDQASDDKFVSNEIDIDGEEENEETQTESGLETDEIEIGREQANHEINTDGKLVGQEMEIVELSANNEIEADVRLVSEATEIVDEQANDEMNVDGLMTGEEIIVYAQIHLEPEDVQEQIVLSTTPSL